MNVRTLTLFTLFACGEDINGIPGDTQVTAPDLDGDGFTQLEDCDDTDPRVHPNASEICDGIDQDCDGVADQGVPNDGEGCRDPGMPEASDLVDIVHLYIRTATTENAGTDDGEIEICLGEDLCFDPYKNEWNDFEPGTVDVSAFEDLALDRSSIDRLRIGTIDGEDRWEPQAFQVLVDGESVYCNDTLDFYIGEESDEVSSWTDPAGLENQCSGIFDSPITHGPIIGAVGSDYARIWFRSDATRPVLLRLASTPDALTDARPVHYAYPRAENDFTTTIEVSGLETSTTWYYDFEVDGERFGPWSFELPPREGQSVAGRFAFGSCSKNDDQPAFGAITAWDPNFFLFIGDNHYGNTAELSDLRQFYRWAHERNMRAQMMAEVPTLATWDDHDFTGNNTDGWDIGKATALRVFEEYWANPAYGTDGTPGVYYRWSWGDVEFFVLDDRYWRDMEDSVLGSGQTEWLFEALRESDAVFKFVVSGSQWTSAGSSDSWAAFPEARADFLEEVHVSEITGVVLLSGDIHRSEIRLMDGATGGYALPELTSSPLANTQSSCADPNSELLSCYDQASSWVGVEFDTSAADPWLNATIYDESGNAIDSFDIRASELDFDDSTSP